MEITIGLGLGLILIGVSIAKEIAERNKARVPVKKSKRHS